MEKYNKLLSNIAELIEKGLFTSKDLKQEIEDSLKLKIEIIASKLNLVSREEYEIQKTSDPNIQNERYQVLTEEWNLMTGDTHEVQEIRLCINNIKRAEYRSNWKKEDRKKKRGILLLHNLNIFSN